MHINRTILKESWKILITVQLRLGDIERKTKNEHELFCENSWIRK